MRIVREDPRFRGEVKSNFIKKITRQSVRTKTKVDFSLELEIANSGDQAKPEWSAYNLFLRIGSASPNGPRLELDDCIAVESLPEFAVSTSLLSSNGLLAAISREVNRVARLTIENGGDGVNFYVDIGNFKTGISVEPEKVSDYIKLLA